jgi:Met-zincin/Domain of unknown function (DUF5117)
MTRLKTLLVPLLLLMASVPAFSQARPQGPPPTIEERTARMKKIDGFFPLYWDEAAGQLFLEIPRLNTEVLYSTGFAAGLGSNDIGIDRGALAGSRIVKFERVGPKVLLVQPNYKFRAESPDPEEVRAVRDAFARSVLFGFTVAAETNGRMLVDVTDFLLRDSNNIAGRLRPGSYRFDGTRSSVYLPMTMGFPKNTEIEAELTFVSQPGGGGGGGGGGAFFEGVSDVAATAESASLRIHHSLVELPDNNYKPRVYDPRSGFGGTTYEDYAAPLGQPMTKRFLRRHRLEKANPNAAVSDPVKPIIYYLDPGVPEPVRSALLEGARWWNQAFEAAGFRNAFRVEMLPAGASSLDIRYNVINWVHRSTRGWSTGGSVADPRTGEIIKGVVELGSLRGRQDYMIAEGILSPYKTADVQAPELREWALARLRQLAAHEVGHTLGLGHNYYDSTAGRISVMDYPHPLINLKPDGTFDIASVYATGIGEWDKVAIQYGYSQFPPNVNEPAALAKILDDAWGKDLRYMTNQDMDANPLVDQWSNGTDAANELNRMMDVRRAALSKFGENAIRFGQPMALIEDVLVPIYLHHRYQVDAASSGLGGQLYIYSIRGDGREPFRRVSGGEQRAIMDALMATLQPSELVLPPAVLDKIPPRPSGYGMTRELFPRYTGSVFDAITPAVVAAEIVISDVLQNERAARIVEQHAVDPSLPGLDEILSRLVEGTFGARAATPYEAEIKRAVERVFVEHLMDLGATATMPQVRALATARLTQLAAQPATGSDDAAHQMLLSADIKRFMDRPMPPVTRLVRPEAPPGAPIGEPAMEWLRQFSSFCVWNEW